MAEDDRKDINGPVTREWVNLKLGEFRAEIRLLVVLSIAGNQLLSHLSVAGVSAGAVGSGALVAACCAKLLLLR